jgi:hypothetical protein
VSASVIHVEEELLGFVSGGLGRERLSRIVSEGLIEHKRRAIGGEMLTVETARTMRERLHGSGRGTGTGTPEGREVI